jgi:hypothetical protein
MIASQVWTIAKMDAWLAVMKYGQKKTAACQEAMEANPEKMEANSDEKKSVTVHEVPKEEVTVKSFGALKKRRKDRHLAVGRCREPKEWTWGNCGCQKKLAASCRRMTRCAGVAQCKGNSDQVQCGTRSP